MYIKYTSLLASALAMSAFAAPLPDCGGANTPAVNTPATASGALTAENIIAIASLTASCAGAEAVDECADASRAAPAINKAFETYKITAKGEQAAMIAYMLFESANFKFNHNRNPPPGRPGQGTRMMAMPPVVKQYAAAVAGQQAVASAEGPGGDLGLEAVLALVNSDDEKSFGAAPWFLTTCSTEVRAGLVAATVDGWHAFLTQCVQTSLDPKRDIPWAAAKKVLGAGA